MAKRLAQLCGAVLGISCLLGAGASEPPALATPDWTDASSLSEAPEGKHPQVAVAMDAKGDTIVVWCQSIGASETIDAAWRPAGGAFSTPVQVSPVGDWATNPAVAVDPQGDATIVWLSRRQGAYPNEGYVETTSWPVGRTVGAPIEVGRDFEDEAPTVAMDSRGDTTITWLRYSGGGRYVQAVSRPAAGVFNEESALSSNAPLSESSIGLDASAPALTMNPTGDVAVAWSASEKNNKGISSPPYLMQLRRQLNGDVFNPAINLMTKTESAPKIAIDANGDVVMAWTNIGLIEATTLPSGSDTFGPPTILSNFNTRDEGILNSQPTVAMDAVGEALVAWLFGTQPVAVTLGGSIVQPIELAKPGAKAKAPVTAMNAQGDSMTMWISEGGNHEGIPVVEGSARPAGGHFNQSQPLTTTGSLATPIQVAIDSEGDAVSAWATSDGTHEFIQVAGYQATGPRLEALQTPTESLADATLAFSVSPLSVWSTVTSTTWSWGDGSPDTSGTDATHIFNAPGTYQVSVRATDALGNVTSATRTVTIQALPSGPSNPFIEPQLKPTVRYAVASVFTPLFATRASAGGKVLGLLVEIAAVRGATNGDTLVIRCIASCDHPLHQVVHITQRHHPHGRIVIAKPLTLRQSTRIEIDLQAPHRITRFVQYRFIRTHLGVIAHITHRGCLSPAKRPEACPPS